MQEYYKLRYKEDISLITDGKYGLIPIGNMKYVAARQYHEDTRVVMPPSREEVVIPESDYLVRDVMSLKYYILSEEAMNKHFEKIDKLPKKVSKYLEMPIEEAYLEISGG